MTDGETTAEQYAAYTSDLRYGDLPEDVVEYTKKLILDILGVSVGGYHWMETGPVIEAGVGGLAPGGSDDGTVVLATGERRRPAEAALINGAMAHSMDYDNHHGRGVVHIGSAVIPAALAAGEAANATGREVITATVAGYEVSARLGLALNPFASHDRGFHPTGTCGVFGATAAIGSIRGSDAETIRNGFGINGSQASGSIQFSTGGGTAWNKRLHPGFACHSAFLGSGLAEQGFLGAHAPIEGHHGFLTAYSDDPAPERATATLGTRYETLDTSIKPYPLDRFTHLTIERLLELVANEDLQAEEVDGVTVRLPPAGAEIVGEPIGEKREPTSAVEAQFSMPFAVALVLVERDARLTTFRSVVDEPYSPAFRHVMQATEVERAPNLAGDFPASYPAEITVRTADREYELGGDTVTGEPERPLSWSALRDKFDELTETLPTSTRDAIVARVRDLEAHDVDELVAPFTR